MSEERILELEKELEIIKEHKAKLEVGLKLAINKLEESDKRIQHLEAEVEELDKEAQELLNDKMKLNDLCSEINTKYTTLKTITDFACKKN